MWIGSYSVFSAASNPILGVPGGGAIRRRNASTIARRASSCSPTLSSSSSSLRSISIRDERMLLSFTKARTMNKLISIALSDRSTFAAMRAPCSVNTVGGYRLPPQLEVTDCDLKLENSSAVRRNEKSSGKRLRLRRTAWLRTFVSTPYSSARSESMITFSPRMVRIFRATTSIGVSSAISHPLAFCLMT